jgi:hypothetical protein
MKTNRTGFVIVVLASLAFVGPAQAQPRFKMRGPNEKEFMTKVGEAVVKAVRTSPTKSDLAGYSITDLKPNRKVIDIAMKWTGSVTGKKYTSTIKVTVDPTPAAGWEVLDIEYNDDNPSPKNRMESNLKALKDKFNR